MSLLEVTRLKVDYGRLVKGIGYSGHHLGIAADIATIALGAQWVERHFTLDRTRKGTDRAASLEPMHLKQFMQDIRNVSKGLQRKGTPLLPVEKELS